MEESYQTAALTASGLSWAAVQQLSGISGGLETRRPKIDLRSRAVDKPKQGVEFSIFHRVGYCFRNLKPDPCAQFFCLRQREGHYSGAILTIRSVCRGARLIAHGLGGHANPPKPRQGAWICHLLDSLCR